MEDKKQHYHEIFITFFWCFCHPKKKHENHELWWKFKVSLFRIHLIHLCNHKKHTISTGKFSTRITSAGTPLKPAKSLRCSWQHSDTPQTRSECWFFWTHLAGQCLPQNIVLRTDAQTLLHLAGERFGMFIRTNPQWKILGVSNIKPNYKHVLTSSCRSEPKTKHRPLLAGIKPQSIPNVVVFPDTKLLMCCAWLLPNMLIAPSNAPLVSARNLPTSVPHLYYKQTSINFVLYKFWWLPAPLWPSNAKISPWYITFKTPSNLVKGSDSDMSDTFWYAIKIHQKRTECSTKSKLSTARIWPNCFESFEISTVWPFRDLCDFRWMSKSELVNAGCPNIIAAASPMSRSTNAVTCHEVQKISYKNLKDMLSYIAFLATLE